MLLIEHYYVPDPWFFQQCSEVGNIVPILYMRKEKLREVITYKVYHEWQSQDLNLSWSDSKTHALHLYSILPPIFPVYLLPAAV